MNKLCFNEFLGYTCNACERLDESHKNYVHEHSCIGAVMISRDYIIDALENKYGKKICIANIIENIIKSKPNSAYCYSNYICQIHTDIYNYLPGISKTMDIYMEVAIYDILIRCFGKINNINNRLYKLFLKANNITTSYLQLKQIYDKHIANTSYRTVTNMRKWQGKLRKILLEYDCKCKICGLDNPDLLRVSHTKPWAKSNDFERLDIYNVFLLCPDHDIIYDKGYISFNDDGSIIISPKLSNKTKLLMNIKPDIKIALCEEHKKYLRWHRENVFKKN